MILIISSDDDVSTQKICKWLDYYKENYILITESNWINDLKIVGFNELSISIFINEVEYNFSEIKNVWYRKGKLTFFDRNLIIDDIFISKNIENEWKVINDYLLKFLKIEDFFNSNINKLEVLNSAYSIGFKIPLSIITSKKRDLLDSFGMNRIISKPVNQVVFYQDEKNVYSSLSTEINIDEICDTFPISFFQEYIEKKVEIRVFYFYGEFYSMAIFSQNNKQTEIDYRDYDYSKPNRISNYELPNFIKRKIEKLMMKFSLNIGCVDLILDKKDNFYFLEINPQGQFDIISSVHNFCIEKNIAKQLINGKK